MTKRICIDAGRLLHVRGGVSLSIGSLGDYLGSSPRPWRCFQVLFNAHNIYLVFSTSVEVFPCNRCTFHKQLCLLHVRGGVSIICNIGVIYLLSSPRPWRCFRGSNQAASDGCVFSTSVEVFPARGMEVRGSSSLLHVRGGVSISGEIASTNGLSSPRPWRCFPKRPVSFVIAIVFSTSVEVFLNSTLIGMFSGGLLHVRGGVSRQPVFIGFNA